MTGFETVKQYAYPDEAQALRVKQMAEIAAGVCLPEPARVAANANVLHDASPDVPDALFEFVPTTNNEGARFARWTLNSYLLRLRPDGSLSDESSRGDWEVPARDRKLARISMPQWRKIRSGDMHYDGDDFVGMYTRRIKMVNLLSAEEEVDLAKTMEAGLIATQKLEGGKAYRGEELSVAQRRTYTELSLLGKDAFDRFYEANLGLVVSIAKRYTNQGMPMLDLIQEGNLGLRHAITKFDYTKGYKFSSYGSNWIVQAIKKALPEQRRGIALSDWVYQRLAKLRAARDDFVIANDRLPDAKELADCSKVPLKVVEELYIHLDGAVSLDQELNREGSEESLATFLVDQKITKPDQAGIRIDTRQIVLKALQETLKGDELDTIMVRYFSQPDQNLSQQQTGDVMGVKRQRVADIEKRAVGKLKMLKEVQALR